jgi:predicted anti-sigma-YlaC factor YlaD
MRCPKAQKLLSTRFDQEVEGIGNSVLETHLSRCSACQRFAANLPVCSKALDAVFAPEPRPGFAERVMARLPETPAKYPRLRGWFDSLRPAPAVAAAVALVCGIFLATLMNGEQPQRFANKDPGQTLYAESFAALPSDSTGARYLVLLQEAGN